MFIEHNVNIINFGNIEIIKLIKGGKSEGNNTVLKKAEIR
jgi:hypothetical protein